MIMTYRTLPCSLLDLVDFDLGKAFDFEHRLGHC